jgi:hypothetical protein
MEHQKQQGNNRTGKGVERPTDPGVAPTESGAQTQESNDPQLRKIHEVAGSDDELGRGNETSIEDGGSRHRTQ